MNKPWEKLDDKAMNLIIDKLIKENNKYEGAKRASFWTMVASFIPLLVLMYLFYTKILHNLPNIFSILMNDLTIIITLFVYLVLAARLKVCKDTEKEFKKDYKDIRAQVTDNLNNIWRYDYDMNDCNEIVDVLNKEHKINISYKG